MTGPGLFAQTVQLLVPQPCFDRYFTEFDLFNVACFKVVLSKGLGFSIILGSVLVKLPQIIKLYKARSGKGLSLMSIIFELIAISANASYGFAKGFPFSSYGDGLFLAIQTSIVLFLVLYFGGRMLGSLLFLVIYGAIMAMVLSPATPIEFLTGLQGVNIFIVILSKLIQAYANFSNGGTGQLSAITVALLFLGSMARIFTSIQETGDQLIVITYVASSIFNGVIAAQVVYYWNKKPKEEKIE